MRAPDPAAPSVRPPEPADGAAPAWAARRTEPVRIGELDRPAGIPPDALVLLVGPSGCGKSTFARRWFSDTQRVSSDECRRRVADDAADQGASRAAFHVFYTLIDARLAHGRLTVADATSLTPWSRERLRQVAAAHGRPVVAIAFDAPLEVCLARQGQRGRAVPPRVVEDHFRVFGQVLADLPYEGYDRLFLVHAGPAGRAPHTGAAEAAEEGEGEDCRSGGA